MNTRLNAILTIGVLFAAASAAAETPAAGSGPIMSFSATTANVSGAPDPVRIDLLRWSTDADRTQLMNAWNMKPTASATAGRGGGRGGRGGGGRGGRGGAPAEEVPATPESTLTTALQTATTVGYLWSSEVAGYAIRYAGKVTGPDGSDRIILITDRRLGMTNNLWTPSGSAMPNKLNFSIVELRVNPKGEGEGKASLTGTVAPDDAAKIVALENYASLPVILKGVHRSGPAAAK
jgi:hypothetical protein